MVTLSTPHLDVDPVNGEYPTGAIAVFTCDDEYTRNGTLLSTCQDSGTWDPQIPTCDEGTDKKTVYFKMSYCYTMFKKVRSHLVIVQKLKNEK